MKELTKVVVFSIILLSLTACAKIAWWWTNYPSDNPVEEVVEEIIKEKTGHDMDLSPLSKEECNCECCEAKRKENE